MLLVNTVTRLREEINSRLQRVSNAYKSVVSLFQLLDYDLTTLLSNCITYNNSNIHKAVKMAPQNKFVCDFQFTRL